MKDDASGYLAIANNKSEWIWGTFFNLVIPGYLAVSITTGAVSILLSWLITGHFDREFAFLPEKFV